MADLNPEPISADPAFITYLLTPDLCDCFFIVGNRDLVQPERIGVVKKMLLAHSVVLRSDMLAREMEDKKDVPVNDTYPDTFKNMLRFVYGYDNTGSLDFDEADNLLYVAEKYQVESLKARLSARLIKLLTPDNICGLLNNPACYKVLELDRAITHILQYETDKVLASPQFVDLTCDALVKIVEQEAMNVPELEVWKSAVRWATHRVSTSPPTGNILRELIEKPAKHLRVCTIDNDSFFKDVITTDILTADETYSVCLAKGHGVQQEGLVFLSNKVECRTRTSPANVLHFSSTIERSTVPRKFDITTKNMPIELVSFSFKGGNSFCKSPSVAQLPTPSVVGSRPALTYTWSCIIRIIPYDSNLSLLSKGGVEVIPDPQQVREGCTFSVPLAKDGKITVLQPNTKYCVYVFFDEPLCLYGNEKGKTYSYEYISVTSLLGLPITSLTYRTLLKMP